MGLGLPPPAAPPQDFTLETISGVGPPRVSRGQRFRALRRRPPRRFQGQSGPHPAPEGPKPKTPGPVKFEKNVKM